MKTAALERVRLRACVRGVVQGVGFRPFVFRLATELGLNGWVNNSPQGVFLEIEGVAEVLNQFLLRLESEKPPRSSIHSLESSWLDPAGFERFEIRESDTAGKKSALILPDIATCPDCLREILDPQNRRYLYPFTNCTNCGPRFSIIESLPYDRANTSMQKFAMCPDCQAEYNDPTNRRFHAQPNACSKCGPHLELWNAAGEALLANGDALQAAARALQLGKVVAVKGLGGFHLMVAAHNARAVRRLRDLKRREEKPLAVMFPSVETVKNACEVSPMEARLLGSPEAPIVLLRRLNSRVSNSRFPIAPEVAPGNPNLGVFLPCTPLHHLLLRLTGFPVVATSGNLTDEPICIDEREALDRLGEMADLFLVHDRPIIRHLDDSVARVILGREQILRRARGYAPLPISLGVLSCEFRAASSETLRESESQITKPESILAVGAHLKNSVALAVGTQTFLSQHIGDLETEKAYSTFQRVIVDLRRICEITPDCIAADAHPDYLSTKFASESAERTGIPMIPVQHHFAHVLSCMAENELAAPVLGVSWDGTGYGLDGTIWGGEFFRISETTCERVAYLRPFRLPGGDRAVKEPRRSALGLLHELHGDAVFQMKHLPLLRGFSGNDLAIFRNMLNRGFNSPLTSSAGRLFDAVAALVGLHQQTHFEGQAAMALEFALEGVSGDAAYDFELSDVQFEPADLDPNAPLENRASPSKMTLDWSPMIEGLFRDLRIGVPVPKISLKFHNALADAIVFVAKWIGVERVALTGGCFQNRYLTERSVRRLREEGFRPYWHQRVPPNDGGIALGQVAAARRELKRRSLCV